MASEKIRRLAASKKDVAISAMGPIPTARLVEIENLFVQKLEEKFKLTERDIQRAFKRFDTDGSGFLSANELCRAISIFVPGVPLNQVQELVQRYDVDGDGQISIDEFTQLLISRSSPNKEDWLTVDYLMAPQRSSTSSGAAAEDLYRREEERENFRAESSNDPQQLSGADYKAKIFMQNVRAMLVKRAMDVRGSNKLPSSTRLGQHTSSLVETIGRDILSRAFQPYVQRAAGNNGALRVDLSSFSLVMKKFVFPGAAPVTDDTLRALFSACGSGNNSRTTHVDPDILADLIFDKGGDKITKFGFVSAVPPASDTGRPTVQHGPLVQKMTFQATQEIERKISDIPMRFVTRRCRTALAVPSDFDLALVERSCQLPQYECQRDHVFGLSACPYSGPPVYTAFVNDGGWVAATRAAAGGRAAELLVYACAALGVVHDLSTNTQRYFEGHSDDICCLTVSADRLLAASGQVGRGPEVLVWATALCPEATGPSDPPGLVARLGKGFFERGVCGVEFAPDNRYLCAISCDEKHTMGVWTLPSAALVASMSAANGVPPQVKCICWAPRAHNNGFISADHASDEGTDLICTVGERHLKFWSFRRVQPRGAEGPNLVVRAYSMGKVTVEPAKAHRCVVILDPAAGGSRESTWDAPAPRGSSSLYALTGGDNGGLFMWKAATCVRGAIIVPGGIYSLAAFGGDKVVCGGAQGVVKVVDCRTFAVLQVFSVLTPSRDLEAHVGGVAGALSAPASSSATLTSTSSTSTRPTSARPASRSSGALGPRPGTAVAGSRSGTTLDADTLAVVRKTKGGAVGPKGTLKTPSQSTQSTLPAGSRVSSDITGVALVLESPTEPSSVVAVTGVGRVVRFELNGLLGGLRSGANGLHAAAPPDTLFHFHSGPVWALAVEKNTACGASSSGKQSSGKGSMFATGGDDRYVNLWCAKRRLLLTRARAQAPLRSLDFDGSNTFLAAGMAGGYVSIFELQARPPTGHRSPPFQRATTGVPVPAVDLALVCVLTRKDCQEDISDVKFSPNSRMLAVGSHDQCVDLYVTTFDASPVPSAPLVGSNKATPPRCQLKHLRRLRGHTSFITHLDWSADNRLLRTCCASYELLYWDVGAGKQFLSSQDALEADTQWQTGTCVLGFPVMGIWPPNADGSDVNAVDVLSTRGLVVTGDDSGYLNVMNYPCVAKHAPRRTYGGHSSHVMSVKFMPGTGGKGGGDGGGGGSVFDRMPPTSTLDAPPDRVVTVGGNDASAMVWRVVQAPGAHSGGSHSSYSRR